MSQETENNSEAICFAWDIMDPSTLGYITFSSHTDLMQKHINL